MDRIVWRHVAVKDSSSTGRCGTCWAATTGTLRLNWRAKALERRLERPPLAAGRPGWPLRANSRYSLTAASSTASARHGVAKLPPVTTLGVPAARRARAHRSRGRRRLFRWRVELSGRPGQDRAGPRRRAGGIRQGACQPGRAPPGVFTVKAVHGFPVEELIDAGKDADMLVLGSRGAGGFTRLMMGSTAGQVTQHAHCPVVIIPPEDRT
jgi:nucleotide-binding universal stress UspA family protein